MTIKRKQSFALDFYTLNFVVRLNLLSEVISELFANCQTTYAKRIIVTTWSKKWWNNECKITLETYRQNREYFDQFSFYSTTRLAKQYFFDNKIAEIASANKQS